MKCFDSYDKSNLKTDPQHAINFLKKLGRFWTIWPVSANASRFTKVYHECSLWFIIINLFFASLTLWMSVCVYHKYPILMAKNLSQLMIISDSFSHLVLYRINRSELQVLVQEVFDFMKNSKQNEKYIMRKHYNRFLGHYTILIVLYVIASLAFFCGAFILGKKFPMDASYPFSTDSILVSSIIFTHQTFSIVQNSVLIMIDLLVITLFWYAGARIKILGYKFKIVDSNEKLKNCIKEHQKIIQYVASIVKAVRFILYKTISIVAIIIISAGLQLLYYDAKVVISQFSLIIIVACFRIITYSSTIEEMKQLNEDLRWTVYKSSWFCISSEMKQCLQIFIHRCQIPLVTIDGQLLNIMSLAFFAKLIYSTVSHLTTLRAIIERS
ncbi:hypothetical protein TSAR_001520 [Trichomalopsis sarcophagae]|uniref:Odorant receptor n=1 Tax=Trichomalopsis sarcophagae TaxID=543379 RepID=A0A232EVP5_9HYME|nr:hypothetical protein TSAR_001520 [Trichomalopsis sarcophagae]